MRIPVFRLYLALLSTLTLIAGLAWAGPLLTPLREPGLPSLSASLKNAPASPQRVRVLGYERALFGDWAMVGACTTRELVVAAQLYDPSLTCELPLDATGLDPYTGGRFRVSDVEVDHIFPLSAAWDSGAHAWNNAQRQVFANDPVNLVGVAREVNQAKSDLMPAQWLPPDRGARCWYVRRLADVAATYQLSLSQQDRRVMRKQCPLDWS